MLLRYIRLSLFCPLIHHSCPNAEIICLFSSIHPFFLPSFHPSILCEKPRAAIGSNQERGKKMMTIRPFPWFKHSWVEINASFMNIYCYTRYSYNSQQYPHTIRASLWLSIALSFSFSFLFSVPVPSSPYPIPTHIHGTYPSWRIAEKGVITNLLSSVCVVRHAISIVIVVDIFRIILSFLHW